MSSLRDMKDKLFGPEPRNPSLSVSSKKADPYDRLAGSGWELVDPGIKKEEKKPMGVEELIAMLRAKPEEQDIEFYIHRLEYWTSKAKEGTLDATCLDISKAEPFIDEILCHYMEQAQWPEYKLYYDLSLELQEHLAYLASRDPGLPIQTLILGIQDLISSSYKDIQEVEESLL